MGFWGKGGPACGVEVRKFLAQGRGIFLEWNDLRAAGFLGGKTAMIE